MIDAKPNEAKKQNNAQHLSSLDVVWQWLTYGLWWFALAGLSMITTTVIAFFIDKYTVSSYDNASDFIYYVLATVVLAIPAFFIDRHFSRTEQDAKHGFAGVIMVLHAVLVAFTIIAIAMTVVILGVMLARGAGSNATEYTVNIITCIALLPFSAWLLVRIIRPKWRSFIASYFRVSTLAAVVTVALIGMFGVYKFGDQIGKDRFIDDNLPLLDIAINDYANTKDKLPKSLSDIKDGPIDDNTLRLTNENKVNYQIIKNVTPAASSDTSDLASFEYKLCVTYQHRRSNASSTSTTIDYTSGVLDTSRHLSGKFCYKATN